MILPDLPPGFARAEALARLSVLLAEAGYSFVTPTPETIRRVNARPRNAEAGDLAGVFGWSRPFHHGLLPADMLQCLTEADALIPEGDLLRSRVRFSRLGDALYLHSAYPTTEDDAVFFGPDTYRFARLIADEVRKLEKAPGAIADVGCGSGAGGLFAWETLGRPRDLRLVLADINARALEAAGINAAAAGCRAELRQGDLLATTAGRFDLIIANPPYLVDPSQRLYRHGGGSLGFDLSLRILETCLARLGPGGRLVLYTGSAIIDGRDEFQAAAGDLMARCGGDWRYQEIDPDVFGEELDTPAYGCADRIAAVALIATREGQHP